MVAAETIQNTLFEAIQKKLRSQILISIAEKGLLPKHLRRAAPCVLSGDATAGEFGPHFRGLGLATLSNENDGPNYLSLSEIDVGKKPGASLPKKLIPLVFEASAGLCSVTLERTYKLDFSDKTPGLSKEEGNARKIAALRKELENRLFASVVLIYKPQTLVGGQAIRHPIYSGKPQETYVFDEYRTTHLPVKTKDLLAILVPSHLLKELTPHFPNVPCIEVNPGKNTVTLPMFEVGKYWPKRMFEDMPCTLSLPDYVAALETLVNKHKIRHFASHIVRLPTKKDVEHNLAIKAPMYLALQREVEHDVKLADEHKHEAETKAQQEAEKAKRDFAARILQQAYKHFCAKREGQVIRGLYHSYKAEYPRAKESLE